MDNLNTRLLKVSYLDIDIQIPTVLESVKPKFALTEEFFFYKFRNVVNVLSYHGFSDYYTSLAVYLSLITH